MQKLFLAVFLISFGASASLAALSQQQRDSIDQLTGAKGVYTADEDTHRVSFPRNDLKVKVEGRVYAPFMGFTSWAAFTSASGSEVEVMGDFVLAEDEVDDVMSTALDGGLEVTALHNHFFYAEPRVMFMHIGGHGEVAALAPVVRKMVARIGEIRARSATVASSAPGPSIPAENAITGAPLETIVGAKGEANSGMFKITIGRKATMHGHEVGKQMGINTWAAFAGTDQAASVDGDFLATAGELQPVLKALRKAGISIVAIHSHMAEEQPRYIFLHYWGKGPAADLAKAVRGALDAQAR